MIALILATVLQLQPHATPKAVEPHLVCGAPRSLATDATQTVKVCEWSR